MNTSKLKALFDASTDKYGDARRMGTTYQNLTKFLKGDSDIRVSTLERIAAFYHVPVGYFFDEADSTGCPEKDLEIARLKGQIEGLKDAINILSRRRKTSPGITQGEEHNNNK